jgi:hypothetical protein
MTESGNEVMGHDASEIIDFDKLANDVTNGGKILIKAVYGKQQGRMKVHPRGTRSGQLLGVKRLSPEQMRNEAYPVTGESFIWLEDDLELDLRTPQDAVTWDWLQHCTEDLALSYEAAQASPDCFFFVKNDQKEAEQRVSFARLKKQALDIIFEQASATRRVEICRLLGQRMEDMPAFEVEEYLISVGEKNPQRIISAFTDKNAKTRLFLLKAVDKRIVRIENEIYKYGGYTLGISEEHAILWLKNPENSDIVDSLKADVFPEYFAAYESDDSQFDFDTIKRGMSEPSDFGAEAKPEAKPASKPVPPTNAKPAAGSK